MSMPQFRGIVPPVVTPFDDDGAVDTETLRALIDHLVDAGCHGIFTLGSTSEVAYLTDAQRADVLRVTVEQAAGRVPVYAGCIDLTAARVAEQARAAADLGASAVVATGPIYALGDRDETADHFRTIAAAADVPVIAYDVPVRVHSRPGADLLVELGREGTLAGVKDSSGDDVSFRLMSRLNEEAGHPLQLMSGHELVCDGLLLMGADGLVPGLANVDAAGYVRLWEAAQRGDWDAAVAEQQRLIELFQIVFASTGRSPDAQGVGGFKTAMRELGLLPNNNMASPVQPLKPEAQQKVARIVAAWRQSA